MLGFEGAKVSALYQSEQSQYLLNGHAFVSKSHREVCGCMYLAILQMQITILHMHEAQAVSARSARSCSFSPSLTEERAVVLRIEELRRSLQFQVSGHPRRWTGSLRRAMFARANSGLEHNQGIRR